MLVVATVAFGEAVRLFFFNFTYQIQAGNLKLGPHGGEGFRQIRYFPENGWSTLDVVIFIWIVVVLVMAALWWLDHSRAGAVLRAVGEDELAAQSAGINITAVKVLAMTIGGVIAGIGGGIFAHYTTHIEHVQFGVVLATFAIAYPILGGLSNGVRDADRGDLHPGLPDRGPALHGRLAQPPVRRFDRARDECAARAGFSMRARRCALKRLFSLRKETAGA